MHTGEQIALGTVSEDQRWDPKEVRLEIPFRPVPVFFFWNREHGRREVENEGEDIDDLERTCAVGTFGSLIPGNFRGLGIHLRRVCEYVAI